jgi:hypothetical protein
MKKFVKIVSVLMVLLMVYVVHGGISMLQNKPANTGMELYTPCQHWCLMRAEAAENGAAALDLDTDNSASDYDWPDVVASSDNIASTSGLIDAEWLLGYGANGLEIAFFSDPTDSENDTFDFELFAYRDGDYGPPVKVYGTTGNGCAIGTQIIRTHPTTGVDLVSTTSYGGWCDTISGTDYWGGCSVINSGNNRICRLIFDRRGYRFFWVRIFNAAGGGTECAGVGVVVSGY